MNTLPPAPVHSNPWKTHTLVLREVRAETPGVCTYEFDFTGNPEMTSSIPGQFNMLYVPGSGEAAISMSSIPADSHRLVHTIREAGNVTNAIARMSPGETIGMRGPFGNGWPMDQLLNNHVILVGGGIGMAPLRPVIESWLQSPNRRGKLSVLIGARSPRDLLFRPAYERWQAAGIDFHVTVDRTIPGWDGHVGVVPSLIERLKIPDPNKTHLFVCGPEIMMTYTALAATESGVPAEQIWFSLERHMNCAVGHCGRCQFGSHFVCTHGPVFRYTEVGPLLKIPDL
ncbi:MAG: FAD/NAD(P)-binding protein [Planctomycetaceae bacterium]|nr:FAD/NAD(P)-binding protein [Planctomycetaceae bacterium]